MEATNNVSGIYKIENIANRHCYIGSAINIEKRWNKHISLLNLDKHHSKHLQNAWNKYGAEYFNFSILEFCDKDNLINKEQLYINEQRPEYNMTSIAGSVLGIKRSEETKNKISIAIKGIVRSLETRNKIRIAKTGKPTSRKGAVFSDEHRANLSKAHKGIPLSDACRASMSAARKGKPSHRKGKLHSEESKKKMSESMKLSRQRRKENRNLCGHLS